MTTRNRVKGLYTKPSKKISQGYILNYLEAINPHGSKREQN